jgi:hypothetical protein
MGARDARGEDEDGSKGKRRVTAPARPGDRKPKASECTETPKKRVCIARVNGLWTRSKARLQHDRLQPLPYCSQ